MAERPTLEGPPLEALLHRAAETPPDFLGKPLADGRGTVHVAAVVHDLFQAHGVRIGRDVLERFEPGSGAERNELAVTLLFCWLLADPGIREAGPHAAWKLLTILDDRASELAAAGPALQFINDPDRREELVRVALAGLGLRPASESIAQAEDRLASLSSTERARVVAAARKAERRARAIREALVRKKAEESADKWTRE